MSTDILLTYSAAQEGVADKAERKGGANTDCYGDDIFRSGLLAKPKNPYFVTKIRPKRRHELVR